jgi:formylglycine-generating enzyme required for sulfatase activity
VTSEKTSRTGTSPVGSLGENSIGLCDVRGNLWEFCRDSDQTYRVLRGASWKTSYEPQLRLEFKWFATPDEKQDIFGFRCVMIPDGK